MKNRFHPYIEQGEYKLSDNRINFNKLRVSKVKFDTPKFPKNSIQRKIDFFKPITKQASLRSMRKPNIHETNGKLIQIPDQGVFSFKRKSKLYRSHSFHSNIRRRIDTKKEENNSAGSSDTSNKISQISQDLRRRSSSITNKIGSIRLFTSIDSDDRSLSSRRYSSLTNDILNSNEKQEDSMLKFTPPTLKPEEGFKRSLNFTKSTKISPFEISSRGKRKSRANESCEISFSQDSKNSNIFKNPLVTAVEKKKLEAKPIVNEETRKLLKKIQRESTRFSSLEKKLRIVDSIRDDKISVNYANSLKHLVHNLVTKKNNLEKQIHNCAVGISKYKRLSDQLLKSKIEKLARISQKKLKILEAKKKEFELTKVSREIERLRANQKNYLIGVKLLKNRMVQNCEKALREECQTRIMEAALNGKFHERDGEILNYRSRILILKKLILDKKRRGSRLYN